MLENFKTRAEELGNEVVLVLRDKRWGKWSLGKNFCQGLEHLTNCKYIYFTPDDAIYNRYMIDVVRHSFQYFKKKIKAITFWDDNRNVVFEVPKDYSDFKKHDNFFRYVRFTDGFFILFERDFVYNELTFYRNPERAQKLGSTLVWGGISKQLRGYDILMYVETLGEHIGNYNSSMIGNIRRKDDRFIFARNLNLWKKPEILK